MAHRGAAVGGVSPRRAARNEDLVGAAAFADRAGRGPSMEGVAIAWISPRAKLTRCIAAALSDTPVDAAALRARIVELLGPGGDPLAWHVAARIASRARTGHTPPPKTLERLISAGDPAQPLLWRLLAELDLDWTDHSWPGARAAPLREIDWTLGGDARLEETLLEEALLEDALLGDALQGGALQGDAIHGDAVERAPAAPPFPDPVFGWAEAAAGRGEPLPDPLLDPFRLRPAPAFAALAPPPWATPADLARDLGLTSEELEWFADLQGRAARAPVEPLRHYRCTWIPKASGGRRLIEAPKPRLKAIQRRILREMLNAIPPHPAAAAYAPGCDPVRAAAKHAGEAVVLTLDLRRFFPSIPASRIHALFRTLGSPYPTARLLTGLVTHRCGAQTLAGAPDWERETLRRPHLPQGAPTSPALANLCARRLDLRLSGLAARLEAAYTRYADDLTFSGDAHLAAPWVRAAIAEIVREEGFTLASEKTRVQRAGGRQTVTGIVVNRHVNLARRDVDRLKAILTNCRRHGPAGQNRDGHPAFRAHLDGRVGWVERVNPRRGAKLRAVFEQIDWSR